MPGAAAQRNTSDLPSALDRLQEIVDRLAGRRPAVFLDYDGVLTPIVRHPEQALISGEMRETIRWLAGRCPVAIVSGRDLRDVREMAGIEGIAYAGSHGFDIEGPAGRHLEFRQGTEYLPALDAAERALRDRLSTVPGARVERKRFAVAVHFRQVAEAQVPEVEAAVDSLIGTSTGLRKTGGKKIFELRPDIDWDKGRAVHFLLQQLGLETPDYFPFYLGDDLTDEDAFKALRGGGIGIVVRDRESRPSLAEYALEDSEEVRRFLGGLGERVEQGDREAGR